MKKTFLIILSLFLFIMVCSQCNNSKLLIKHTQFAFKDKIAVVIDSFIQKYPNKKIYELYIDKRSPHKYILMLFGGDKSRTSEENIWNNQSPLLQIPFKGKIVNVYSGAESFLLKSLNKQDSITTKPNLPQDSISNENYWVIYDEMDSLKILKNQHDLAPYPFMKLRYVAPKMLDDTL